MPKFVFSLNVLVSFCYLMCRDHYNEVLMQRWVGRFRDIFDADNYHPVQVIYILNNFLNLFQQTKNVIEGQL